MVQTLAVPCPSGPCTNASLSAFKISVDLPYGVVDELAAVGRHFTIALESENAPGALMDQTPPGFPRSHLRMYQPNGQPDPRPVDLQFRSTIEPLLAAYPKLRYQRSANQFETPWVVAVADPRASIQYVWPAGANKEALGCHNCDRPAHLQGKTEADGVYEIYTTGPFLHVRLELSGPGAPGTTIFTGTPLAYLGLAGRLEARFTTIPADLVRPSDGATTQDIAAGNNLPTAGTQTEGVVGLNTGEVERSATDLAISGRGIDFTLQRFYSSAIAYHGPFGRNMDSPLFARIHRLPSGDVVFYDGTGRRDVFAGGVTPPPGVFLEMNNSSVVQYPDNTRLYFDSYGRLAKITDRNLTTADGSDGNAMLFLYRADGKLDVVLDPTGRPIHFDYYTATGSGGFPGCISKVTDFDGRVVSYSYDGAGRLTKVDGPDPASPNSAKPTTTYTWSPASTGGSKQQLYTSGQITNEQDALSRTLWSVGYDPAHLWAASTLTSGGGTWTFTLNPDNTSVLDPNGHTWQYGHDGDNHIAFVKSPTNDTTTYGFDGAKRLASIARPLGDTTTYGYASAPLTQDRRPMANVTTVTEKPRTGSQEAMANMARTTTIGYGPANLPTSITNPDGATTTIVRDARGNPQTTTDSAGVTNTTVFDEHGQLKNVTDPRTGTATYAYVTTGTKTGYLSSMTTTAGTTQFDVDNRGNVQTVTAPGNKITTYTVNKLDQVEKRATGDSSTNWTFDAAGNVATRNEVAGVSPDGTPVYSNTTFTIDELGRLRVQSDNGVVTTYAYDIAGNFKNISRTGMASVVYGYDAEDRLVSVTDGTRYTQYGYDADGFTTSVTNARGKTTVTVPSGFGDRAATTNPFGISELTTIDAAGRPIETHVVKTTATGDQLLLRWSQRQYDFLGRVTQEIQKLFTNPLPIPQTGDPVGATDIVTKTIYDDMGHKVTRIDPRGGTTVTELDELGRPARVTDPAGNVTQTAYDPNGNKVAEVRIDKRPDGKTDTFTTNFDYDAQNRLIAEEDISDPKRTILTQYGYDERGNKTTETDAEGSKSKYEYDLRSHRTKETDPEGGVTEYTYDDGDRLASITDANGNLTTFMNDEHGNVIQEKRADGATWTYTYDENNNRQTSTDANGTTITFSYDDADRLVSKAISKAANVLGPSSITFTPDDLGRIVATATDEGVKTSATYDSLDRELNESQQLGTGPLRTIAKTYDPAGNVIGITYPSGLALTQAIDPLGRISSITQSGQTTPIVTYADAGSRLVTRSLVNGTTATWSYDPNARLASIEDRLSSALVRGTTYQRTPLGNKAAVTRADLKKQWTYSYNRNSWITNESISRTDTMTNPLLVSTTYDIDRVLNYRNVTRQEQTASTMVSNTSSSGINSRNQYSVFGGQALSYDPNGNLKHYNGATLQYDAANRLAKAQLTDGTTITNLYDARGRKLQETLTYAGSGIATESVLCGDQILEEYTPASLMARYVRGRYVDEIVRAESGANTLFPLQNELANTDRLTDSTGTTVERYEYEGYGKFRVFDGSSLERTASFYIWRWLFQGREAKTLLGAYDFRARVLWPELGRFGQEDPRGVSGSPNRYQAFGGDFADRTDPSGESTHTDKDGWVIAIYEDDHDLGVYYHGDLSRQTGRLGSVRRANWRSHLASAGFPVVYKGETAYGDEFSEIEDRTGRTTGRIAKDARIAFDTNFAPYLLPLEAAWKGKQLYDIASNARHGRPLDIKLNLSVAPYGSYTGRLLNGKYASARSAGNYLAGFNAANGRLPTGQQIDWPTCMRVFGAFQQKGFDVIAFAEAYRGREFGPRPWYGEIEYSGRRDKEGFEAARPGSTPP